MIKKINFIYLIQFLTLVLPFILLGIFIYLIKDYKNNLKLYINYLYNLIFSKEFEFWLIILIVGLFIVLLILYFFKNNIEQEINKYTFTRIYSPKTYEKIKRNYTVEKLKLLKKTPEYKKLKPKNEKKNSNSKLNLQNGFKNIINESILSK